MYDLCTVGLHSVRLELLFVLLETVCSHRICTVGL